MARAGTVDLAVITVVIHAATGFARLGRLQALGLQLFQRRRLPSS